MKAVIICGGVGSKMWPMSRSSMPKHFLPLIGGKSLFELNYEALMKKFGPKDIFLQTNEVQAKIAKILKPEIPQDNVFIEPEMRNQGPATGFAAAQLIKRGFGDEPFILVQADVLREPDEKFLQMIDEAGKLTNETGKYLTGGFVPNTVLAGVDYLVKGKLVNEENGVKIYEVADYIDRTEKEKIKQYLGTDKLLLHANHTTMTPNKLLEMYKKYKPEWEGPLVNISKDADVAKNYAAMPKGAIEEVTKIVYKNNEALVVELPFNWVDFGTWESVANYMDDKTMYIPTDLIQIDARKNFVYRKDKKMVVLIGVEDLVVIDTGDALLISKKIDSGKVGQAVDKLKEAERNDLL
jgi:mannose-1-phosphate guanylyltransferase / mannose-6-phosphate isomerase